MNGRRKRPPHRAKLCRDGAATAAHPGPVHSLVVVGHSRWSLDLTVASWERGRANICWGATSRLHRKGPSQGARKAACPHFADTWLKPGEGKGPAPGHLDGAIRSLWIVHIPEKARASSFTFQTQGQPCHLRAGLSGQRWGHCRYAAKPAASPRAAPHSRTSSPAPR